MQKPSTPENSKTTIQETGQLSLQETINVPFANLRTEVSDLATSHHKHGSSEANLVSESSPLFQRRVFSPLFSTSADVQEQEKRYLPDRIIEEKADWVEDFPVRLHPEEELATRG